MLTLKILRRFTVTFELFVCFLFVCLFLYWCLDVNNSTFKTFYYYTRTVCLFFTIDASGIESFQDETVQTIITNFVVSIRGLNPSPSAC